MNWAHVLYMYLLMAKDRPNDYAPYIKGLNPTHQEQTRVHFRRHNYLRRCNCLCCAEVRRAGWEMNADWKPYYNGQYAKFHPGPEVGATEEVGKDTEIDLPIPQIIVEDDGAIIIPDPQARDWSGRSEADKQKLVPVVSTTSKAPRPKGWVE